MLTPVRFKGAWEIDQAIIKNKKSDSGDSLERIQGAFARHQDVFTRLPQSVKLFYNNGPRDEDSIYIYMEPASIKDRESTTGFMYRENQQKPKSWKWGFIPVFELEPVETFVERAVARASFLALKYLAQ